MSRRRRATEPVFSFDSFLDVVANLTGIIIRLMLVVMVGAHLNGGFGRSDEADVDSTPPASVSPALPENAAATNGGNETPPEDPETARLHAEYLELQRRLLATTKAL